MIDRNNWIKARFLGIYEPFDISVSNATHNSFFGDKFIQEMCRNTYIVSLFHNNIFELSQESKLGPQNQSSITY